MREHPFKYSIVDAFLAVALVAMFCMVVRTEYNIRQIRRSANVLADQQQLLSLSSKDALAVRKVSLGNTDPHFRVYSNTERILVCVDERTQKKHVLGTFPAGEHVVTATPDEYVNGQPTALVITRFTAGQKRQAISFLFPDGVQSYATVFRNVGVRYADAATGVELLKKECSDRKLVFLLR